jgi:hypothetical protein
MIADKIEALLADKGYDADAIREELTKADVEAVIPAKSNRREPIAHDRENIAGATSSSACSTSSRTGGASQHDTTKPGILPRLCQSRVSPAVDTLCPRNLVRLFDKPAFVVFTAGPPHAPRMYEEAVELVQGFGIEACPNILPDRAVYRHASAAGASVIEFELRARLLPRSRRFTCGPLHR